MPSAERQSARVYVRNRGREVILRLDTSKGIGSPLPTMYIILSQPLMNSKLMIKPQQLRTIDDIGRWINDPRKIAHQYLHSIKAP